MYTRQQELLLLGRTGLPPPSPGELSLESAPQGASPDLPGPRQRPSTVCTMSSYTSSIRALCTNHRPCMFTCLPLPLSPYMEQQAFNDWDWTRSLSLEVKKDNKASKGTVPQTASADLEGLAHLLSQRVMSTRIPWLTKGELYKYVYVTLEYHRQSLLPLALNSDLVSWWLFWAASEKGFRRTWISTDN